MLAPQYRSSHRITPRVMSFFQTQFSLEQRPCARERADLDEIFSNDLTFSVTSTISYGMCHRSFSFSMKIHIAQWAVSFDVQIRFPRGVLSYGDGLHAHYPKRQFCSPGLGTLLSGIQVYLGTSSPSTPTRRKDRNVVPETLKAHLAPLSARQGRVFGQCTCPLLSLVIFAQKQSVMSSETRTEALLPLLVVLPE